MTLPGALYLGDPIQVIFILLVPVFIVILLVAIVWYAYRHGKRVGRLEAGNS